MKNEKLIALRKERKLTQAKLSEKMYIPISTIRNWEYGLSVPTIEDMQKLASIFRVKENVILSIFKPPKTKIAQENEKEIEIYNLLLKLFWECKTATQFIKFTYLFSLKQMPGAICCCNYTFPFTKIISDENGSVTVFADSSENYAVLTDVRIKEVKPISADFDVYSFDIVVDFPLFPTDLKYSPEVFRQKIRVSIFNR